MQIDTQFLETILTQAKSASRLAGVITDASNRAIVIDELTSSINEIVRMLAELLGDPAPIDEPVPSARSSFAQAASLLDEVIYEQVVECIDLDALYRLEHSLTLLVGELDGISDDRVCETAKAMLNRALRRLPDDVWRYLRGS